MKVPKKAFLAALAAAVLSGSLVLVANAPASAAEGAPPVAARYLDQQIAWGDCPGISKTLAAASPVPLRQKCGTFVAPKDYHHQDLGDIKVGITRVSKDDQFGPKRQLFINPGGPGGAGFPFPASTAIGQPQLLVDHDFVAVDPRGTGLGTRVDCDDVQAAADSRDLSDAAITKARADAKRWVADCAAKHGDILPYITTEQTVRDMDLGRVLLGAQKIDYQGTSAGTWLGAQYQKVFPDRAGRFVLDSNAQFSESWQTTFEMQPMAFQRRFDEQFLPWLSRHDANYGLGDTPDKVKETYEAIRVAAGQGKLGKRTPNDLDNAVTRSLYSSTNFPGVGSVLQTLNKAVQSDKPVDDSSDLLSQILGVVKRVFPDTNPPTESDTVFTAITCNDTAWRGEDYWVEFARKQAKDNPLLAPGLAVSPCNYWPYQPVGLTPVTGQTALGALMLQDTLDPATAYEGALAAHRSNPATRMVTVINAGDHGVAGHNSCADVVVNRYLQQGVLPGNDVVCQGVPMADVPSLAAPMAAEPRVYEAGPQLPGALPATDDSRAPSLVQQINSLLTALATRSWSFV
ncbi:alpha/beta fold hydrolase [Amycolatopsis nalaikhensis]|uniref:Alpha/beta fold hydrolase n=1 Tax=Amycolatopsis nalaikhensis TaxID=715472 RepID=A0ABY8XBM6_9PSEU|nr:alpha/beta fold hydrolase [Amycolatopsis sp. 2-2]WIV52971.1 alpha/beta fold hydrolase [Amycolatopsis sp. 2-2]